MIGPRDWNERAARSAAGCEGIRVVAEIVDDLLPGFYWKDNRVLHTERQTCFVGKTLHDFTHQIRHVANATNNGSLVAPECFNAKASEVRVHDELVSPKRYGAA